MIKCQDSPVAHLMRSRNELSKSRKFACSLSSSFGSPILTRPKIERPMIANMKKRIIRRSPREPSDGAESSSVWKIICSYLARLINLRTLPIRKALRTVGPAPTSIPTLVSFMIRMIKVRTTIMKSNMFQESWK